MVLAICSEISLRKDYLQNQEIATIYFGGGTPSVLSKSEISQILDSIYQNFEVAKNAEITLEANPDDLSAQKLQELKNAGINRLSIGIQSFDEKHLKYMNRSHNSEQARICVSEAQKVGFQNISIDLIYGVPSPNHEVWKNDLQTAMRLNVPHISAYCLTIEPKTVFGNWLQKKKIKSIDDEFSAQQFDMLLETLSENNFEHYEISNFGKKDFYSKHNTSYWSGKHYLGVGAAAHSFNGKTRQYNVSNNSKYVKSIEKKELPFEIETLSEQDKINEYLMTSLRTKWGCDLGILKNLGCDLLKEKKEILQKNQENGFLEIIENTIFLSQKGKLLADEITANLFVE